jgi:seryl-tRNA synthetase
MTAASSGSPRRSSSAVESTETEDGRQAFAQSREEMIATFYRLEAEYKQLQEEHQVVLKKRKEVEVEIAVIQRKSSRLNELIAECQAEAAKKGIPL